MSFWAALLAAVALSAALVEVAAAHWLGEEVNDGLGLVSLGASGWEHTVLLNRRHCHSFGLGWGLYGGVLLE